MNTIPGPKGHPVLGSLNAMRGDFLQFLVDTASTYGRISQFRAGPARMVLLTHPDDIADVLVKRADLFQKTRSTKRLLSPLLGEGLISLEGGEHRHHRRVMQPAFHARHVHQYSQMVVTQTLAWLAQQPNGAVVNIVPTTANLMLNIVVATFFSGTLANTDQVRSALHAFSEALDLRVRSPLPLPGWLPTHSNRTLHRAVTALDTVITALIADRRHQPDASPDLLTMLLMTRDDETGQALSDAEIRDEIATIFFAGYETTTTTLSWLWYLLATHPDVQQTLRADIQQATHGDMPDIQHMPYLDQVIREVLRLYPAAWLFDREPTEETTLAGCTVRAGQTLFISPYLVQRSPEWFDAPDQFRPERFRGGLEKSLPRFAYFPFGGGPRICIGQPFALHSIALIVATLLPRLTFEVLPGQSIRPAAAATLVPAEGIHMRVHRA